MIKKLIVIVLFLVSLVFAGGRQRIVVYMAGEEPAQVQGVHKVLGGELAKAISHSDRYLAVDRTDAIINQLAKEYSFQRSGMVSDEQIKELGLQFGSQYLCIAEISALRGGSYYLDVRLVDVVTAEIVHTVTATSDLKDGDRMIQVARQAARELVGQSAASDANTLKAPKKLSFWTGIELEVVGVGFLIYGLYEEMNVRNIIGDGVYQDGNAHDNAKSSARNRNIGYLLGSWFLLSGVSVHIVF